MTEAYAYYDQYRVRPVEPRPSEPVIRTRPNGTIEPTQVGAAIQKAAGKRLTPPAGRRVEAELLEALADGAFDMRDVTAEQLNLIGRELVWRRNAARRRRTREEGAA